MRCSRLKMKERARRLRRDQTDAERVLWARLRDRQLYGAKFRRQHPISQFVADFCCPEEKLVVELDGGQHSIQVSADQNRSSFLENQGCRVLRFWNHEVLTNINGVLERIVEVLGDLRARPHPSPLPRRGRGNQNLPSMKLRQRT